jgi:hypothetical protein
MRLIDLNEIKGEKNKGNFAATLIQFNQNLNYEKIYVFQRKNNTILCLVQDFLVDFFANILF